jgi:endoglucanase
VAVLSAISAGPAPATAQAAAGPSASLAASAMHRSARARLVRDRSAGRVLALSPGARAKGSLRVTRADALLVRARRAICPHAARLRLSVDGHVLAARLVSSHQWISYPVGVRLAPGLHTVEAAWSSGSRRGCRDGLLLDRISLRGPPAAGGTVLANTANPLAASPLYVSPDTPAQRQVRAWQASRPADAAQIAKIASRSQAVWFASEWNSDVRSDVANIVRAAADQGRLPVLVDYNLPNRDCGGYSSGGAASASEYRTWTRDFAAGIGGRPAVVVLEPDALAALDCLSASDRQTYVSLLGDAVTVLTGHPNVAVYLDAGNSGWQSAATMAARLSEVNVAAGRGFSLNVSNFRSTADELAYGDDIAARLGGKHFVVDTSRNGRGPAPGDQWCNPAGRALGAPPGSQTGDPLADGFLWVKAPGESDGACNGGPAAGMWWADYALGLAQRAAY